MLPNNLTRNILLEYEAIRDSNSRIYDERIKMLYSKYPRLKQIMQTLEALGLELTASVLSSPKNAENMIREFEENTQQLLKERAYILSKNQIPANLLDVPYNCPLCKDTGYLENNKKCKCFTQKMVNHLYDMSNIKLAIERENFNTFNVDIFSSADHSEGLSQKDNITQILSSVESYVYNFSPERSKNLLFYGPTGQGKTFFCNAISKNLMDKGFLVIYQTAFKLIDIIEKYRFSNKDSNSQNQYQLLFDADLLIIDDLGTEFNNSFTNAEIFNIINGRLLANKPIIISTNLSLGEIEKVYSNRVSSRIYGNFEIFKFYGPDVRWSK
ncbi:MAG: ATP-binding protein [Clostridiales bacterium]|nr:ATP-binding protein [Clostridiales bacterium]